MLTKLFVKPEFRGLGFATQALEFLTLECQKLNVVALASRGGQHQRNRAKACTPKLGFETTAANC